MSIFDMDDFRDPDVVEAEERARKENSMFRRAINSGLDIAHQMLHANEMALQISLRDAMNDGMKQRAEDYRAMHNGFYQGTAKDEKYQNDIRARAEKSAQAYVRTPMTQMNKSDDAEFYY